MTLRDFAERLVFGGTRRLRSYEAALLERAATELGGSDHEAMVAQIRAVALVQRFVGDRQVNLYFGKHKQELPRIKDVGEARCVVKLTLRQGIHRRTAAVVTHLGLLSSLEFSKTKHPIGEEPFEILGVELNARHRSPADAADRLEHGRS